jgi:hypothetical protein
MQLKHVHCSPRLKAEKLKVFLSDIKGSKRARMLKSHSDVVTGSSEQKGPELWPNDWILHHYRMQLTRRCQFKQFLAQKSITEMEHPPYSPDLVPNDFYLFPKINVCLKRTKISGY